MAFCFQNKVSSTRITSLYGSQSSSVVFACKTASFGSELQVSMNPRLRLLISECKRACLDPEWSLSIGPSPHLLFCACKTSWLALVNLVSMGLRPHLSFCACKTAWLASELQVSMGPSPHLWFLHAKQRLLDQITSLYGSQALPVDLCMKKSILRSRMTLVYWYQPSSVVFACKTMTFGSELQVSMGPRLRLLICECKREFLDPE